MILTFFLTLLAFGAPASALGPLGSVSQLGDQVSAVQTISDVYRAPSPATATPDCPMQAAGPNYDITAFYEPASSSHTRFLYTLTPHRAWRDQGHVESEFLGCHCHNTDLVVNLQVLDYISEGDAGDGSGFNHTCEDGSEIQLNKATGEAGGGNIYTVMFSVVGPTIAKTGTEMVICGVTSCPSSVTTPPHPQASPPVFQHTTSIEHATAPPLIRHTTTGYAVSPIVQQSPRTTMRPQAAAQEAPLAASPFATMPPPQASPATTVPPPPTGAAEEAGSPASNVDSAGTFGDPHVGNLKGEKFNILQPSEYAFLVIPRGADKEHASLHVLARVVRPGPVCDMLLYVTALTFSGQWLGDHVKRLEFSTSVDADMDAAKALKIKVDDSSTHLSLSEFKAVVPTSLAEVTEFKPTAPAVVNQHATTLLLKLTLGPCISKVRMVYQMEKSGFSNSLWLTTTGLGHVDGEIGGILGVDPHSSATGMPKECADPEKGDAMRPDALSGRIHAMAMTSDDDGA